MSRLRYGLVFLPVLWMTLGCRTREPAKEKGQADPARKEGGGEPAKEVTLELGGGVKLVLVLIPAGKFAMGRAQTEDKGNSDEGPLHAVTIGKAFCMGKCEVTQQQYGRVMGNNSSYFKDGPDAPERPVEQVSWDDAQAFLKKPNERAAGQLGNTAARLPTEAEWEYACRAGTKTRFCTGDADRDLDGVGWHMGNSDGKTHPVGSRKPNAWGLYDMHGNVTEWCQDWCTEEYEAGPAVDPQGPGSSASRVLRGGSWANGPGCCRSAFRSWYYPSDRASHVGFRVVVALKTP